MKNLLLSTAMTMAFISGAHAFQGVCPDPAQLLDILKTPQHTEDANKNVPFTFEAERLGEKGEILYTALDFKIFSEDRSVSWKDLSKSSQIIYDPTNTDSRYCVANILAHNKKEFSVKIQPSIYNKEKK